MFPILIFVFILIVLYVLSKNKKQSLNNKTDIVPEYVNHDEIHTEFINLYNDSVNKPQNASYNYDLMIQKLRMMQNNLNSLTFTYDYVLYNKQINEQIYKLQTHLQDYINSTFDIAQEYNRNNIYADTKLIHPTNFPKGLNYYDDKELY